MQREQKQRARCGIHVDTHTKAGHAYWSKLNRKWREENKTLEEKLLSDD